MYIEHLGDSYFQNLKTGDTGILSLLEPKNGERNTGDIRGSIKNKLGKETYKVFGKWDQEVRAICTVTNKETMIWKAEPLPPGYEKFYYYNDFTLQLNHLTIDQLLILPDTDCRLRPD